MPAAECMRSVANSILLVRVILAFAIVGLILVWWTGGIFSSPEENLIGSILGMRDGFNQQDAGDVLVHCSENFKESEYFLDLASFRGALLRIFLSQRDRSDGSFLWQALVEEKEIEIELDGPAETARVAMVSAPIRFVKRKSLASKPVWVLRIDAQAYKEEDGRWRFIQARFKTISGRRPF